MEQNMESGHVMYVERSRCQTGSSKHCGKDEIIHIKVGTNLLPV